MKYMWSKNRIAKYLLPIILKDRKPNQWYVEPFVWGANMIDKVDGNRIWSDFNEYLIYWLITIRDELDIIPKNNLQFSEQDYKKIKNTTQFLKGYIWFACSYSWKWFWGWCRGNKSNWIPRDYVNEAYKNAVKQNSLLQWIKFIHSCYQDLEIPNNSIIYCDIPYKDTTKYKTWWFDYEKFYNWCREKKKEWHSIYISEYNMPKDFKCLWQKEIVSSLTKDTWSKKATEKLFTL